MLYTIEDKTLTALGDAVRKKINGGLETEYFQEIQNEEEVEWVNFDINAPKYKFILDCEGDFIHTNLTTFKFGGVVYDDVFYSGGDVVFPLIVDSYEISEDRKNNFGERVYVEYRNLDSIDNPTFKLTIIPLDENGEEYRYTPLEMVEKINDMGVIPEGVLTITGNCQYRFAGNGWNWFIEQGGDKITTKDLGSVNHMFDGSHKLVSIPFSLNFNNSTNSMINLFYGCSILEELPQMNNVSDIGYFGSVFYGCERLREIPEDYTKDWGWNTLNNATYNQAGNVFYNCYSLRYIDSNILKNLYSKGNSTTSVPYYYMFPNCHSLDEVRGLVVQPCSSAMTASRFNNTFSECSRLKEVIFAVNEDGTPKTANWKSQTIDLSTAGYASSSTAKSRIITYNSGITADKEVSDDFSYAKLKNDPDWFSTNINFSRYNHDSAVNTINSLPDCSATGTNTIKFKGVAGLLTDGGAINTLTEEEIAVAAAKGWTVSLV